MSTQVILTKEVEALGAEGDVITVADGYARNYLIPRGLAIAATPANLRRVETLRKKREAEQAARRQQAEEMAKKLSGLSLTISAPAGADGKLFGAITTSDIAHALQQRGIEVDRKKIVIEPPLREIGIRDVTIKLHPEVQATVRVEVVASATADQPAGKSEKASK
ncbi:MAG: 50S ribosomal protein L9 [Verrucomicrobiae bacterium]|nr:50S ribosomal protein L9 [Verrucomicrobiae bacterium]